MLTLAGQPTATEFTTAGLHASIRSQIEYYFTIRNLEKDHYLRSLMDKDGWVAVSALMEFKMVKSLTTDQVVVSEALHDSRQLQIRDGSTHVRTKNRPRKWVPLPVAEVP